MKKMYTHCTLKLIPRGLLTIHTRSFILKLKRAGRAGKLEPEVLFRHGSAKYLLPAPYLILTAIRWYIIALVNGNER